MSEEKKINIEDAEETLKAAEQEAASAAETSEASEVSDNSNKSDNSDKSNVSDKSDVSDTPDNTDTPDTAEEVVLDPLAKAEAEAAEWKDKYIRLMAEFDNYRKRVIKEKAELILNGSAKTIEAVLPVLDDFERALADKTDDPEAIKQGMDLIFKKFHKTLEGLGVKRIDTDGADFDTDYHEAIAMVPGMGDDKKGKVIDCVQTGYTLNDKVIRHAKVAVGQ